jgi:hypothetical protein
MLAQSRESATPLRAIRPPPRMPPLNPWLTDSVCPTSHVNPAATDAVRFAGPAYGRKLEPGEVSHVPLAFCANPVVKQIGYDTIAFASSALGIHKILLTGKACELVSFVPYPGLDDTANTADEEVIAAVLSGLDAAKRTGDEAAIVAAVATMADMGVNSVTMSNGEHNFFDRDGYHYCVYGGNRVLKSTDRNSVGAPVQIVRSVSLAEAMPGEAIDAVPCIVGLSMTYDGHLAAATPGAVVIMNRNLTVRSFVTFAGEVIENGVAIDRNNGIYVVTSKRMHKLVWTGSTLSSDGRDGAWSADYDTMSGEVALALGAASRGSGTTPALMGFGDDPDKLVVIADSAKDGTNLVAFWRDEIPASFRQKAGTRSRRIADQVPIRISQLSIERSPTVMGYGVAVLNTTYPNPILPPGAANAFIAGVTRSAPMGVTKFTWDPGSKTFDPAWTNAAIDNSDMTVPAASAASGLLYCAHKQDGDYQYLGLDWITGEIRQRWSAPDDSRLWNGFRGMATILDDGDLMIGGLFGVKRLIDAP